MPNILIIDDDEMLCDMLCRQIKRMGHNVTYALTVEDGAKKASLNSFDVVFLDVYLPDGSGLEALPRIREVASSPEVIIFTGQGDPNGAKLAIKTGAWDYIEKPPSIEQLRLPLIRALQYRHEKKGKPKAALKREGIVGSSRRLEACLDLVAQASNTDTNVLITGETGTGKELFARAIHNNSPRTSGNFVVVDCTALPETLVESMLLGHEKGAFTGADRSHVGLIKQADGGTLFLDEVGELPPSLQKSFLRVLQEHRFRPIGSNKEVTSDFRLVAATNRDLEKVAQSGQFRQDLLYRLKGFVIELPPLRHHKEDLREIVLYHMTRICERYGTEAKGFSPEFFQALFVYDWPGNVRQLVNALDRASAAAHYEPTLFPKHLPDPIRIHLASSSLQKNTSEMKGASENAPSSLPLPPLRVFRENVIAQAEKRYLQDLMSESGANINKACRISGLSRARLYALLQKHNICRKAPYWIADPKQAHCMSESCVKS